jgi:acyl carrier protein
MNTQDIAATAANVMYIDDVSEIDVSRSLFNDYSMSSLDFVDFAFELKSESGKEFSPDQLWPINTMMDNPDFYAEGEWSPAGKEELIRIFDGFSKVEEQALTSEYLHNLFSVQFVEHRLAKI